MRDFSVYINVITTGKHQNKVNTMYSDVTLRKKGIGHKKQRASVPLFSAELQERECHTVKQTPLTQHPIRSQADTA